MGLGWDKYFLEGGHVCEWLHSKFLPGNESLDSEEGNLGDTPQYSLYTLLKFSSVVYQGTGCSFYWFRVSLWLRCECMIESLFWFCMLVLLIWEEIAIYWGLSLMWILILNIWTLHKQLKSEWNSARCFQSYAEKKLLIEIQSVSTCMDKGYQEKHSKQSFFPLNDFYPFLNNTWQCINGYNWDIKELNMQIYTWSILKFLNFVYINFLLDSKYTFVRNVYMNLIQNYVCKIHTL